MAIHQHSGLAAQPDWSALLESQALAYGTPPVCGQIKTRPEDFYVREVMPIEPAGEGEHLWLRVRKIRQNTDQVAKHIARFCNVPYRDVGFSGLKDFFAITEQWFSVRLPRETNPDWSGFAMAGVEIQHSVRHPRKIKRGTHKANFFSIVINNLSYAPQKKSENLIERLQLISTSGVPNYFGPQRFGRQVNNVQQAQSLLRGEIKVKNRNLRSILISAARAWLFNRILAERVRQGSWQTLFPGEPANLDGSGSVFTAVGESDEAARLVSLDIHPTAPLWGDLADRKVAAYRKLHEFEIGIVNGYPLLAEGLVAAGIDYQRRATRMRVDQLKWELDGNQLRLGFSLQKGQFATSVLREIVG